MTTNEDLPTSGGSPPTDEGDVRRVRADRERLAAERRAARTARRRSDQQFAGVLLICAVLFFAIGIALARVVWRPKPASATETPAPHNTEATPNPGPASTPEAAPTDPPPSSADADPVSSQPVADPNRGQPAYNIQHRDPIPFESKAAFAAHMKAWRDEEDRWINARWDRYLKCLELDDLTRDRVKQAFLATPRDKFCRERNLPDAYEHAYLDIGHGVTISGPHIVCRMTNALDPQPYHKCLEIGTGSGYQAAILANLSNHVYSIEIIKPLAEETQKLYEDLVEEGFEEYKNVHLKADDGYYGWKEYAPFDRIIVTCGIDHIPPNLLKQLAPGGIMVIPVGTYTSQKVLKVTKKVDENGAVRFPEEDLYPGRTRDIQFVPFTAEGEDQTHYR